MGISRIVTYLPERRLSSEHLGKTYGFDEAFIVNKLGVNAVYQAADGQLTSDLAVAAVDRLCEQVPGLRDQIDLLVVCTQTPDFSLPQVSALVQLKAGLKSSVASFDISLGCSGWVYGLTVMEGFMRVAGLRHGVLVTAEKYSSVTDDADRNTKCLFSDGAAATLFTPTGPWKLKESTFGTEGSRYEHLIVRPAGAAGGRARLSMDGRGIFDFVMSEVPGDIERCLQKNGVTLADIDWFVFHQASGFLIDSLAKRLGLTGDARVVRTIGQHGNAVSSSIPLALESVMGPTLSGGGRVLVSGFGVGLSWATALLEATGDKHE